ncbi:hypothetical protein Tco_0801026 [Tanacetum coccineum]|uniref:Uncharacterized protein n=1 Tax=Tanacetum coccineum TaxID=301880 RepID=A0ABQ4ZZ73_9ASTR
MDEVVVNPTITIKAIGHQWYRSAPLYEGDLSATECLKNMVYEASGLPVISHSRPIRPALLHPFVLIHPDNYGNRNYWAGRGQPLVPAPLSSLRGRRSYGRSCEGGQSKIILFLYKDNRRSQRLGATLFLSYSSFFMISCRGEQTKQKRGPSQRKEKDLQRQRLLTLFLFLAVFYESGKPPQRDPQNRIEKGGQGSRKSLPPLPGQDRWEGALSRP